MRGEVDDIARRCAEAIEPVARGLERDPEMNRAKLARSEVRDQQQRPATAEILGFESADGTVITASIRDRPPSAIKGIEAGRLSPGDAMMRMLAFKKRLFHGAALGLGPQVRRGGYL